MKEREILEKSIEEHQTAIDTAKGKLAELDKPKQLRHGDYGIGDGEGGRHCRIVIAGDVFNELGAQNPSGRSPECDIWLGNLFDDLKRNSKDLREFTKRVAYGGIFQMRIVPNNMIEFYCGGHATATKAGIWRIFDDATEIHQKLGQLIATAKRDRKCQDS